MRAFFRKLVQIDGLWMLIDSTICALSDRLRAARTSALERRIRERLGSPVSIASGLFSGMVFDGASAVGSPSLPKLVGTYEQEISDVVAEFAMIEQTLILDIGCAEGYYAVGLARMFPTVEVRAYDVDPDARASCVNLAEANGVDNIHLFENCSKDTLYAVADEHPSLIICDAEGAEKDLFDSSVVSALWGCTFLVEIHDYVDRTLTAKLLDAFSTTHENRRISSLSDDEKVRRYSSPVVSNRDDDERLVAFAEMRCERMEWLVARPKRKWGV